METLYSRLKAYSDTDYYGFHMPGHKRNQIRFGEGLPYGIDITEIEGFDDLHHADGIIKEAQQEAARLYGAEETKFLVNGSTAGILSAVLGCTKKGDQILVARNCHKSVYHAIFLNELEPVYLWPGFSRQFQLNTEISVSAVKAALTKHSRIKAVVIVSPTYDGVVSDIESIAEAVHERGIPLIVDEAHGAHFGFHPYFPENALKKGADVVIHSLHKTLPSLTQTALLHMRGEYIDKRRISSYLDMLQSSSPSYILMASIHECIRMLREEKEQLFEPYVRNLDTLRKNLQNLKHLKLVQTEHYDRSKLVISVRHTDMSGRELYRELLEKYHLQMEMAAGSYVLAMTSSGDTKEGFARFEQALFELDAAAKLRENVQEDDIAKLPENSVICTSAKAALCGAKETTYLPVEKSEGMISLEYAYLYPPGCPMIVPGERISRECIKRLAGYQKLGFKIEGLEKEGSIGVWNNG
ncbi:aminotransferase class I/II-fold pyridoxal phosphate-dependent enzyme [Claveliimonas bilis]|uniref:Lysine decarboxylase n=1 Tax=Claveliimonas bilis TaxID=3028070 RepID=A0ABM9SER1_9FIRM|nr:aminotransferase class I/II-fold pyridoxal phosphate-dependent enzyme [Claveliimonas bilis]BDZ76011.1 lysine decarboxylase [Claveliimonas bilis]